MAGGHRVPPRDAALRRRYYGLLGKAKKSSGAQRQHLLQLARGLMEIAPGERPLVAVPPSPPAAGERPRPRRRVAREPGPG